MDVVGAQSLDGPRVHQHQRRVQGAVGVEQRRRQRILDRLHLRVHGGQHPHCVLGFGGRVDPGGQVVGAHRRAHRIAALEAGAVGQGGGLGHGCGQPAAGGIGAEVPGQQADQRARREPLDDLGLGRGGHRHQHQVGVASGVARVVGDLGQPGDTLACHPREDDLTGPEDLGEALAVAQGEPDLPTAESQVGGGGQGTVAAADDGDLHSSSATMRAGAPSEPTIGTGSA